MPLPPQNFTKSKWLAFFAELTSKITHHNVVVVIEGCEILKRLLVSRISVGAFLEEGNFLRHYIDVLLGAVRCRKPSTQHDAEMVFSMLHLLRLILEMIVSFQSDDDEYYSLLAMSNSGMVVEALGQMLQSGNAYYFGFIASLLHFTLISLPFGRQLKRIQPVSGVALAQHIRTLEESIPKHRPVVQELVNSLLALREATSGAAKCCVAKLHLLASVVLQRFSDEVLAGKEPNECSEGFEELIHKDAVRTSLMKLGESCNHDEFFVCMNEIWCWTVATSTKASAALDEAAFEFSIRKYLDVAPLTAMDVLLYRSVLAWLSHLQSVQPLEHLTHERLLAVATASMTNILKVEVSVQLEAIDRQGSDMLVSPRHGMRRIDRAMGSTLSLFSFFLPVARTCTSDSMNRWIQNGLLSKVEAAIQRWHLHRLARRQLP